MNSAAEFQAAFPEPQSILGLRLLPLSLGRYRLLKRFDSPFVQDEEKNISLQEINKELFFALAVCGLSCDEFCFLLNNGKLKKELNRWGKKLKKIVSKKGFNIFEHIESFRNFIAKGSEIPWVPLARQDMSEISQAHWSSSIESVLRSRVGWTAEEINEQPLTKALADYFKFLESEGVVKLYDHEVYQSVQAEAKANGEALEKILKELEKDVA